MSRATGPRRRSGASLDDQRGPDRREPVEPLHVPVPDPDAAVRDAAGQQLGQD